MGKIKCISKIVALYFVANFMNSCKEPEFILINHKGGISDYQYKNKYYNFRSQATFFYLFETDTIRLKKNDLPSELKRNLIASNKNGSEALLRIHTKTNLIGDFFVIYNPFVGNLNDFSNHILRDLKKLKIKNIDVIRSENIMRTDTLYSLVFTDPTDFIKKSEINVINYEIINKKDSFSVIECHLPLKINSSFLRVIYCINIQKSLINLDVPKFLKKQFRQDIYSWVASIDTSLNNNPLSIRSVNNLFRFADSIRDVYGLNASLDSIRVLEEYYTINKDWQSKSYCNQIMMTSASFAGNNLASLKSEAKAFSISDVTEVKLPKNITSHSAIEFIVEKYSNEPMLLLNEAHNRGQNRDFARKLLPKLYKKGFRYFAVEALDYFKDSLITKRGFPILTSGYYLKESAFSQLIRDALKLGFKLVSYEDKTVYNPNLSYIERQNIREIGQAKNLTSIFENDKSAKVLVYAGYQHIEKKTNDNWIKMAEQLCKTLNRNIPSIDCVLMKEGYEKKDENKYYIAAIDSFKFKVPIVLVQNDTPFVHPSLKGKVDFNVFLPRTNYDLGYPDWLKETDDTYYKLKLPENCDDAYLQVYKANEWNQVKKEAIPVMQFTIQKDRSEYKLYLRKGDYKLFISKNNKNLVDKDFKVE